MKELIEYIVGKLVDEPNQVQISEYQRGLTVNVRLKVAKKDMGRVIGKNGRVANAMRMLLRVAAVQVGKRANLDIEEPR